MNTLNNSKHAIWGENIKFLELSNREIKKKKKKPLETKGCVYDCGIVLENREVIGEIKCCTKSREQIANLLEA